MSFLDSYTLGFSVLMIVFEILAGVAVLLGLANAPFSWLLLLLILFFSFLTGYAVLSGKSGNADALGIVYRFRRYNHSSKTLSCLC
jgi:uncharacterized membrane protein YphA (DoxX/SURF4 family)